MIASQSVNERSSGLWQGHIHVDEYALLGPWRMRERCQAFRGKARAPQGHFLHRGLAPQRGVGQSHYG